MKVVWEAHDRACLHETAGWEGTLVSPLRGASRCKFAVKSYKCFKRCGGLQVGPDWALDILQYI